MAAHSGPACNSPAAGSPGRTMVGLQVVGASLDDRVVLPVQDFRPGVLAEGTVCFVDILPEVLFRSLDMDRWRLGQHWNC